MELSEALSLLVDTDIFSLNIMIENVLKTFFYPKKGAPKNSHLVMELSHPFIPKKKKCIFYHQIVTFYFILHSQIINTPYILFFILNKS